MLDNCKPVVKLKSPSKKPRKTTRTTSRLNSFFNEDTEVNLGWQIDDQKEVTIVGGASGECLDDVEVAAKAMGVKLKRNERYIYSASHCPIK